MDLTDVRHLLGYHNWANERMLRAVEGLTPEEYQRPLRSSFPSVKATLAHMLNAEAVWLGRLLDKPLPHVIPDDVPTPGQVRERWAELREGLHRFVQGLPPDGLDRPVTVRTSSGRAYEHTVAAILQHLVNHATYHRGQLAALLRQVGAEPPATDLILYERLQGS